MNYWLYFVACLTFGLQSALLPAQDIDRFAHQIDSKVFDGEREIKMFLPAGYFRDTQGTFFTYFCRGFESSKRFSTFSKTIH